MNISHFKQAIPYVLSCVILFSVTSCGSVKMTTDSVKYLSVRPDPFVTTINPEASIAVSFEIDNAGELSVGITNLTDEIMVIDQTKSFFVGAAGKSESYYDPTVRVQSTTSTTSGTAGVGVNLGAVAGAFGVGGIAGAVLNGVNVGGSSTNGIAQTNTVLYADEPQISLGPKSKGRLSKTQKIYATSRRYEVLNNFSNRTYSKQDSWAKYSVCISFSADGGKTFDKIVTDFYVNHDITSPVLEHGKVNDALRKIYELKPDALSEPYWQIDLMTNKHSDSNHYGRGYFINCK